MTWCKQCEKPVERGTVCDRHHFAHHGATPRPWPFPSRTHRAPACVPATITAGPRGSMGEENHDGSNAEGCMLPCCYTPFDGKSMSFRFAMSPWEHDEHAFGRRRFCDCGRTQEIELCDGQCKPTRDQFAAQTTRLFIHEDGRVEKIERAADAPLYRGTVQEFGRMRFVPDGKSLQMRAMVDNIAGLASIPPATVFGGSCGRCGAALPGADYACPAGCTSAGDDDADRDESERINLSRPAPTRGVQGSEPWDFAGGDAA